MKSMLHHWSQRTLTYSIVIAIFSFLASRPAQAQKCLGINDHIIWRTNAQQDVAFTRYADSNTKFLRVGADWNVLETSKGVYNTNYLSRLDYFFQKATTAGIRVLLLPAYAPSWANGGNAASGYAPTPDHYVDYADFCEFLLARYSTSSYVNSSGQGTLEAIELWNEPDLADIFFKPYARDSAAGGAAYGNMVKVAGGRLMNVRAQYGASNVKILAPVVAEVHSVCWAPTGSQCWMDAYYGVSGVTACYDVFSWHSYWQSCGSTGWLPPELPPCWNPSNQSQAILGKLISSGTSDIWAKMVAHGDSNKPNWCTETGGAARSNTPNHNPGRLLSFAEQQTLMGDTINTLNAGSVTNLNRVYWYELLDEPGQAGDQEVYGLTALNASNPIVYNGETLQTAIFTPKAAYAAYKNAAKTSYLFLDDFNDGNANGWTATAGVWDVVGGAYHSSHNAATGITTTGDAAWQNYVLSAKMKFDYAWKSGGLVARYNGTNGYYLRIGVSSTISSYTIVLMKGTTTLSTVSINNIYDFTTFHNVALSVKNEGASVRILGSIDGTQYINYLDASSPYTSGKIALRTEPWSSNVYMDDVIVAAN